MLQKVSEGRQYCKSGPDFRLSAVWACISLIDVSNGLLDLYPKSVLDIRSLSYAVSLAVMRQGWSTESDVVVDGYRASPRA
jgi:hypothetical protein